MTDMVQTLQYNIEGAFLVIGITILFFLVDQLSSRGKNIKVTHKE